VTAGSTYLYDGDGRRVAKANTLTPPVPYKLYWYGAGGDILAANDTANGNWTYSYDAFNRLVGSNKNSGQSVFSYVYDRFGNRWQQNGSNSFLATFTGNNPGNPQNNNRMDGYSYDAAGNLMNDGAHSYTYDAENRLTKVDSGNTATYIYDADGRRVQETTTVGPGFDPAGTNIFAYDQSGRLIQKLDSSGGLFFIGNIYAGGRHLATVGGQTASGGTTFSHSDWLGTERLRTNWAAAVSESCSSLPFGDALTCSGGDISPLHFTGKERDPESGLDYFGARFDSSSLGRFMSPDWSATPEPVPFADLGNPQSLNLYTYTKNNPTTLSDPDGHCDIDGEHHNWIWCAGHSLGITQTLKERVAEARSDLSGLKNLNINGQSPQDFAKNATDKQVLAAKRAVVDFVAGKAMSSLVCPEGTSCAVIPFGFPEASFSEYVNITTGGSVPNISTNVTPSEFGANLETNGFVKSIASDGTPIYTKGTTQYTVYSRATSTGQPTAQVKIGGQVVGKIRLKPE
jgi:RHS repeat-associated protein